MDFTQMVSELYTGLEINETELKAALVAGNLQDVARLKTQRDELKNSIIDLLQAQLKKAV